MRTDRRKHEGEGAVLVAERDMGCVRIPCGARGGWDEVGPAPLEETSEGSSGDRTGLRLGVDGLLGEGLLVPLVHPYGDAPSDNFQVVDVDDWEEDDDLLEDDDEEDEEEEDEEFFPDDADDFEEDEDDDLDDEEEFDD